MTSAAITILLVNGAASRLQALQAAGLVASLAEASGARSEHDAVLFGTPTCAEMTALAARADLAPTAIDSAVVVLAGVADDAAEALLLHCGVEAVVLESEGDAALVRAIRHAVERKRLERAARMAYATDLATGLPHEAQLLEHMSHLLALRDREPVPMVLIVLRVEGFARAAARLGAEAGNILRRKVAVRLRGGLRASDVVASLGQDTFAVLLGRLEAKGDGERVAAKLARTLQQPILVSGQPCNLGATLGLAVYPDHGKDARALLQRAAAQAGQVAHLGEQQFAAWAEAGEAAAANDDTR